MKLQHKRTVLVVDDDEVNLMIIIKGAQEAGYRVKPFMSSEEAWEFLKHDPNGVDIALLDKMMPGMNGIDMLKHIKSHRTLKHIPVILQTGDVGVEQMREGLENGAYYYLSKPFHPDVLKAILHSAENECAIREEMMEQINGNQAKFVGLLQEGEFTLRTHAEARVFAAAISRLSPQPEMTALGLVELLANSIEHGNLDIGFEKKSHCLWTHTWVQELAARAESPEYGRRTVRVHVSTTAAGLHLVITDEGNGFDWQRYVREEDRLIKLSEPSGRGIAKSLIMLGDVRYVGKGNEVHCIIGQPANAALARSSALFKNGSHPC